MSPYHVPYLAKFDGWSRFDLDPTDRGDMIDISATPNHYFVQGRTLCGAVGAMRRGIPMLDGTEPGRCPDCWLIFLKQCVWLVEFFKYGEVTPEWLHSVHATEESAINKRDEILQEKGLGRDVQVRAMLLRGVSVL